MLRALKENIQTKVQKMAYEREAADFQYINNENKKAEFIERSNEKPWLRSKLKQEEPTCS